MIHTTTKNYPTDEIVIPRTTRQRTDLTPASVFELAVSIAKTGAVLQNIGVDDDTKEILYGERRLTAIKLLHEIHIGTKEPELAGLTKDQILELRAVASPAPSWSANWTKIPARVGKNLTPIERQTMEFIENAHRKELPWQDKARAVYTIHQMCRLQAEEKWTGTDTANLVGLTPSMTNIYIETWTQHEKAEDKTKEIITGSETVNAAIQAVRRMKSRTEPKMTFKSVVNPVPKKPKEPDEILPSETVPIIEADFIKWAANYRGLPFNFIHCDFPYGTSHMGQKGGNTSTDIKALGEYEDDEQTYFDLIDALCASDVVGESAHVMFWYSMSLHEATIASFKMHWPNCVIQSHPMIWHKSDNSGIAPDTQRYGSRNYETALLITRGDRLIVSPRALCYAAPWGAKIHRSQKPIPVLRHFLSMFVDQNSRVLDPTCGSGASIVAASSFSPNKILGLELNPDTAKKAQVFYLQETK